MTLPAALAMGRRGMMHRLLGARRQVRSIHDTTASATLAVPGDGVFESLKQRLLAINTPAVADSDKEGLRVMDSRLRPIRPNKKFVGVARTVTCYNDFLSVIKALDESVAGEVLVIDTQGSTRTVAGELFATEAKRRGLEAILIDGPCRDTSQIAAMDFPVYCTSVRPISGTASKIYPTQTPVTCGGVIVHPGDIVFGDQDGVIVASLKEVERLISRAEGVVAAEDDALQRMHAGESLLDILTFHDHHRAIVAGKPSSLAFA